MKNPIYPALALVLLSLVAAGSPLMADGIYEQVFELQPGWNAIFLEVEPEDVDVEATIAGLPLESLWMWNPPETRVDFIQNPADGLLQLPGWLHFVPRPRPESLLNNLFRMLVNRAYLIEIGGTTPVTWRVRGRPSLVPGTVWRTESFNLLGLGVSPTAPPTFGSYFAPSPEHVGQPIYELAPNGVWQIVASPETTTIDSGRAYWIFCNGASTYQGPIEVEVSIGNGLNFARSLETDNMMVRNGSGLDTTVRLRRLDSFNAVPLEYRLVDRDSGEVSWIPLPEPLSLVSPDGLELLVELGVRRLQMTADSESVLEITSDLGTRTLLPVSAGIIGPATVAAPIALGSIASSSGTASLGPRAPGPIAAAPASAFALAGLWVGEVRIDAVSESQLGGAVPLPTGDEFPFRVLIHVGGGGEAVLLKEVIQMWQDGTDVPDPVEPEFLTTETPGRYVLLTDDSLISEFQGADYRDGVPVGFRLSTAAYDFDGTEVQLEGVFGQGGSLTGSLVLEPEAPTNPYRHQFHPDHDNLDRQFLNFRQEAFAINRDFQFDFAAQDPTEENPPGWGTTVLAGTFREAISGLHRNVIFVDGSFRLTRTSNTPVLNQ